MQFQLQSAKHKIQIFVAVFALFLLVPLAAFAAARWSAPRDLGDGSTRPAVALDANGTQHFVWWNPLTRRIQYRACAGTDALTCGAVETLPGTTDSYYPNIAVDPQGRPNVVFEALGPQRYQVYYTRRDDAGWSPLEQISNEPYSEVPDIAIGGDGVIHIVYQSRHDNTASVYYVTSNGSAWYAPVALDHFRANANAAPVAEQDTAGELAEGFYPRLALGQKNRAHVVWTAPSPYGIRYRYQTKNGWSNIVAVANGKRDQVPDIAFSPGGSVGIVWAQYKDLNAGFAEYKRGKENNRVTNLDAGTLNSFFPRIATDCAGKFHIVLQARTSGQAPSSIIYRRYDPATNTMSDPQFIEDGGDDAQTPAVAATNILSVIWFDNSGDHAVGVASDPGIICL